ncbi:MAG TPA: SBBP repeat-containing protein, partial [Candidatus Acidoferrales bacterium]|nr:SBBP repeat-containing protein [Candidatus Acidoferrales bacterium]
GIGVDTAGRIYVGGDTTSPDFPVTPGAYQITNSPAGKAFVALFDPTKTGSQSLVYSTLLGGTNGSEGEVINGLAVDANGNAVVAGSTSSSDFPTTADAFQAELKNPSWNAFLTKVNPSGSDLMYSTYFGGSCSNGLGDFGDAVALDSIGNPYLAGTTCSTDLPLAPTTPYQSTLKGTNNAFVARFVWNPNPTITSSLIPSPNANGWNNSPVTVLFTCTPGPAPIQSCTPPFVVRTEGANQAESGTVTDTEGNSASTTATVDLDMTPPAITITSPTDGSSVSTGTLAVTGTITDSGSGPGTVNCHGTPASLSGGSFSCNVYLATGVNFITVTGSDLAGNASSANISVTNTGASGQTSPPSISGISPTQGGIGTTVILTGSGFGASQGTSTVVFNGIPAQALRWSDSSVSVSVPVGLNPGNAMVSVGVNGSLSNVAQFTVSAPLFVSPSQVTLTVGNTQPIELRDGNGVSISGATWTFSNPAIAQVNPPANGQPMLVQGNGVGITTLTASYANQTGAATITVLRGGSPLPSNGVVWSVPSLGSYGMPRIVDAVPSEGGPAFYAEDDGAYDGNGAIRAFDANGQQLSIWPASPSSDAFPLLVGGDNQGGALYFANQDNPGPFQSYCYFGRMDQNGNETWEYQESNCWEDTAVGPDGTIYLLEDDFQNSGNNVLTALDPTDGQIKFTVLLPGFDSSGGIENVTAMPPPDDPNGAQQPYCTPGNTIPGGTGPTNAESFEHGNMSIAADGTVYIPLTGGTTLFNGEPCDSTPDPNNPGYTHIVNFVDGSQGSYNDTRTLYLMAVNPDGSYTTQTIDSQGLSGPGWYATPQYNVFLQRPVPDGQGGIYLPIEQTLYDTGGYNVSLPFQVAPGSEVIPQSDDLALGSDGTAYVRQWDPSGSGYRNIVTAVDSGAINWTYQAPDGNLRLASVLSGGGVAVSNDQLGIFLLDSSGNATSTGFASSDLSLTSSWDPQWYASNVPGAGGGISLIPLAGGADTASTWAAAEANPSGTEHEVATCACLLQTSDGDPPNDPITPLTSQTNDPDNLSPHCTTFAGTGSTYVILVGDEGTIGQSGINHDVGPLFNLAAWQLALDLNSGSGNGNVIACRVSSVDDFKKGLIGTIHGESLNGQITGGAYYFGHSGELREYLGGTLIEDTSNLFVGQTAAVGSNIDANNVDQLAMVYKRKTLYQTAALWLEGCDAAQIINDTKYHSRISIAQLIANNIGNGVYAYEQGTYFSHSKPQDDDYVDGMDPRDPQHKRYRIITGVLPIYVVPEGAPHNKPLPDACVPGGAQCVKQ